MGQNEVDVANSDQEMVDLDGELPG